MLVCAGVDELRGDSQSVAGSAHRALEDVRDAQFTGYLDDLDILALVRKGRTARRHLQCGDLREKIEQFFSQTIGKVTLVGVRTHVDKGQYRNRICVHDRHCRGGTGEARQWSLGLWIRSSLCS